jgi:hypothetical protein
MDCAFVRGERKFARIAVQRHNIKALMNENSTLENSPVTRKKNATNRN